MRIVVRIMLRLGILSSVVPLVLAGGVAHDWTAVPARQCAAIGIIAPASRTVALTSDPSAATVKVRIVDRPELADLTIADEADTPDDHDCGIDDIARLVTIRTQPLPGEPIIHLTREAEADYRIYVDSTKLTAQMAAALLVGARGGHTRLASHFFDGDPTGSIAR